MAGIRIKERVQKLKTQIPALYLALKDKETPVIAKVLAALAVAYALSPVDLIPDFIPVLGYLDDILLLPGMIALTLKLIPKDVWERCLREAEKLWPAGKPAKWYYAVPIILIWLLLLFWIVRLVFRR